MTKPKLIKLANDNSDNQLSKQHSTLSRPALLTQSTHEPEVFSISVDNTALEKFTTCPRSSYYYSVLNRESAATKTALIFGNAVHVGLENFYRILVGEPSTHQHPGEAAANYMLQHMTVVDDYRTPAVAKEVVEAYISRHAFPDWRLTPLKTIDNKPMIELAFSLPLGNLEVDARIDGTYIRELQVNWTGRIDLIATSGDMTHIVDHKTTTRYDESFVSDFFLSNQTNGYAWAARKLYPNLGNPRFTVNVIQTKKPAIGTSLTAKGPRGGPPALNFYRHSYDYTPARLDEWANNTLEIVSDFVANLVRDSFPMHHKWCFGKYGACPYHNVCTTEPAFRNAILDSASYKNVTWNPLDARS